ncbi:TIGR04222 domain-containing membrane protein [Streptomyces sp. NBC_00536]|uniref:TIGR04222 domain-containing membrane protein n=1 Tax=Streptomyces sp. NBC_00536 TaxID=2975769 RepID=UPI002E80869B|nr:TIGR04222 domain-containing membrane protein [Streptomyces sp. NBC_00536]WUC81944.1 TIGR04222 domain-containing membrane protein [Streptomyces sp. NBC_00536]
MNTLAVLVWVAVLASSIALHVGIRRFRTRPAGPLPRLHDLSEAAFLSGGPGRVVDAALVSLLCDGRLVIGGPGIVHALPGVRAHDPAERAVLQAHSTAPSGALHLLRLAAMRDPAVQETGDVLADRGLIALPGTGRLWRRWGKIQAVVCVLGFPLAIALTVLQFARPGPLGFQLPFIAMVFPVLLGGAVAGGVGAARGLGRITAGGRQALNEIRALHAGDQSAQVQAALFGLAGVRDPYLRAQLLPAARLGAARATAPRASHGAHDATGSHASAGASADILPVVWCAGSDGGGASGCGGSSGSSCASSGSSGSSCGSSGSSCGSTGSSCGSSGSSCGSSSSCSSGSSCGSSSGSSCSSST